MLIIFMDYGWFRFALLSPDFLRTTTSDRFDTEAVAVFRRDLEEFVRQSCSFSEFSLLLL